MSWSRLQHLHSPNTSRRAVLFPPGEPSCTSVLQSSQLGNCYFIAALSVLAEHPAYLRRLFAATLSVPPTSCESDGRWTVNLHHNGQWRQVSIDDYLPTTAFASSSGSTSNSQLYCGHNRPGCGFWVALFEKAYAKVYGSYGAIAGGDIAESLRDLSGSPVFSLRIDHGDGIEMVKNGKLWNLLVERTQAGHLLACGWCGSAAQTLSYLSKRDDKKIKTKHSATEIIVPNHAYAILNCVVKKGKKMLEIRNPWGKFEAADEQLADRSGCLWLSFDVWVTAVNALYSCVLHHTELLKQDHGCLQSHSLVTVSGEWQGGKAGGVEKIRLGDVTLNMSSLLLAWAQST